MLETQLFFLVILIFFNAATFVEHKIDGRASCYQSTGKDSKETWGEKIDEMKIKRRHDKSLTGVYLKDKHRVGIFRRHTVT